MKLCKYYSLDECQNKKLVIDRLDIMMDDAKIEYITLEEEVIKIKDIGLGVKEKKDLILFFKDNDVIEYPDYDEYEDDEDDEEEDSEDDEYEY